MWLLNDWKNELYACAHNVFTDDEIATILNSEKRTSYQTAEIDDGIKQLDIRNSDVIWLEENEPANEFVYRRITDATIQLNHYFMYDLWGLEKIQLTEYKLNQFYKSHIDSGYDMWVSRKLTLVVQLTDENEYEGGELLLYPISLEQPVQVPKEKGCVIAFPSSTIHEVKPVTKGKRNSLVSWVHGPRFK